MLIPASELVEDLSIYPRQSVDDQHVKELALALRAGANLPPLTVDSRTRQIVDGFHRRRAHQLLHGEAVPVECDARDFPDDGARLLEGARLNAGHGRRFTQVDRIRVVTMAAAFGVSSAAVAVALSLPEENVTPLAARVAVGPSGETVPLKRGTEHLQGHALTADQVRTMRMLRGASAGRIITELSGMLNSGIINLQDRALCERLRGLADLIQAAVPGAPAEPAS